MVWYNSSVIYIVLLILISTGLTAVQFVAELHYKSEDREFYSRWCHWHNPSGRTLALGWTQRLAEMSTRIIFWGRKGGRCVGLTTLPSSCADCLEIWEPHLMEAPGPVQACNWIAFLLMNLIVKGNFVVMNLRKDLCIRIIRCQFGINLQEPCVLYTGRA